MREKFKKFGVQFLLLTAKSFVYLWQNILWPVYQRLKDPLANFGRIVAYVLLFAVSPFYAVYRKIRRVIQQIKLSPAPLLKLLVHRYSLHALVIILASITVYGNVVKGIAAADTTEEQKQLILNLIESDESYELVGAPSVPVTPAETPGQAPRGTDENAPTPLLSYLGEAAFQPYFPTTGASIAPRQSIEEYIVEEGDTLAAIAAKYRLKLETILTTNNLSARALIRPGQKLSILPTDGLTHVVKKGDMVNAIAKRYAVSSESILSFNRLADAQSIIPGLTLIIPGGKAPVVPTAPPSRRAPSNVALRGPATPPSDSGAKLLWPTTSRRINQYFTWRHNGLDIDGDLGSPIYAAESGVVTISGWGGAYGNTILIKHDNGLTTRYGHHSKNLVSVGDRVERGQLIALMGSTGRSTGPHCHFEVITGGRRVNPFNYTR